MLKKDLKFKGDKKKAKELAAFYTPLPLAKQMTKMFSGPLKGKTVLDPACGYGNLLLAVLEKKVEEGEHPLKALSEIYGIELIKENRNICIKNIFKWCIDQNLLKLVSKEKLVKFIARKIKIGDALDPKNY